jgi:hypothetical protein
MISRLWHKARCALAAAERRRFKKAMEQIEREQWTREVVAAAKAVADGMTAAKAKAGKRPTAKRATVMPVRILTANGAPIGSYGLN